MKADERHLKQFKLKEDKNKGDRVVARESVYTPKPLNTAAFEHKRLYTQMLLHTDAFTHRP